MSEETLSAQSFSALLDGECTPAEIERLLADFDRSADAKARWSRLCLTRDALAGVSVAKPSFDLTASVMAAIQAEAGSDAATASPKVVPLRRPVAQPVEPLAEPLRVRTIAPAAARRRWQPLAGFAAAASIAAVVAFTGQSLLTTVPDKVAVAATAEPAGKPGIVKVDVDGNLKGDIAAIDDSQESGTSSWTRMDAVTAQQLDDYVLAHSSSRAEAGMGGALSYARLAVRRADYRQDDGQR